MTDDLKEDSFVLPNKAEYHLSLCDGMDLELDPLIF
jgi:hypothetical protein